MTEQNSEVEIKLTLPRSSLKKLLASSLVARRTIKGSSQKLHLVTVYYDTPLRALREAGLAYRVRRTGKKYECTIKTNKKSAAGFSSRGEYTVQTSNAKPVLDGFAEQGLTAELKSIIGDAQLVPLFTVKTERLVRLLKISDQSVAELAIDRGVILTKKAEDKIDEIELELKEGKVCDLLDYAAGLSQIVPLFPESRSKYARGIALVGEPVQQSVKKNCVWNPKLPLRSFLSSLFTQSSDKLMAAQKQIAAGEEKIKAPEQILQHPLEELWLTLLLAQPLVAGSAALSADVDRLRVPLEQLTQRKRLLLLWQGLQPSAFGEKHKDELTPLLAPEIKRRSAKLQETATSGAYTHMMYKLWSALSCARWKHEEYLTAGQFITWRTNMLTESLSKFLELPGGLTFERGLKALEFLLLLRLLHNLSEESLLSKKKLKHLAGLEAQLRAAADASPAFKELAVHHAGSACERQRGYLEGYLARERELRLAKAKKLLKKFAD